MTDPYEQVLAQTRAWIDRAQVRVDPGQLFEALRLHERRRRRRQRWALALAAFVVVCFVASVLLHPLAGLTCAWVSPGAVVRYGLVHSAGFVVGAALVGRERTWAQILVRALWWSGLLAASVGLWTEFGTLPLLMPALILASALGLLSLEDDALAVDVEDGGFALARHRELVVAMLVLAIADVETLLVSALNHDEPGTGAFALVDLACAAPLLLGVIGLYRLRTWGYVVVLLANLLVLGLSLGGALNYDAGFAALLATTAVVQIGLGIPLARALLGADAGGRERPSRRAPSWLARAVLGLALALGAVATMRSMEPTQLADHCAEE